MNWLFRHKQNRLLKGGWQPRFVRLAAIVLVVLKYDILAGEPDRETPRRAGKETGSSTLPEILTISSLAAWVNFVQARGSDWSGLKQSYVLGGSNSSASWRGISLELDAILRTSGPISAKELLKCLDAMEAAGFFDQWLVALLWQKGVHASSTDTIRLYSRLNRHARIANALIKAQMEVKTVAISPRPWMSKAARPREIEAIKARERQVGEQKTSIPALYEAVKRCYPDATTGTWEKDSLVKLQAGANPPALIRQGKRISLKPGDSFKLGRLDLLEVTQVATLEHAELGALNLPDGELVSVWELPDTLSVLGKAALTRMVSDALAGDEKSAEKLESMLPLAHREIRRQLKESPQAVGAGRLKLILRLYDDMAVVF